MTRTGAVWIIGLGVAILAGTTAAGTGSVGRIEQAIELTGAALRMQETSRQLFDIGVAILGAGVFAAGVGIFLGSVVGYGYRRWRV